MKRHAARTTGLAVLSTVLFAACSAPEPRDAAGAVLPFVVRVSVDEVPPAEPGPPAVGVHTPARFDAPEELEAKIARALEAAGIFTLVVTGDDGGTPADLELRVAIKGNDFGPGQAEFSGATFSTIAWLFTGHLSWLIDNREYPDSNVFMNVRISTAGEEGERPELFEDDLLLKGMRLSFSERSNAGGWFLNILVPPWSGDGDPEVSGSSLADRAIAFFQENEPDRIVARLPAGHLARLSSFLVPAADVHELIIVSRQALRTIEISSDGPVRLPRHLEPEEVALREVVDPETIEELRRLVAGRSIVGIGASTADRFYRIPLLPDEVGLVRVEALAEETGARARWTVHRPERRVDAAEG